MPNLYHPLGVSAFRPALALLALVLTLSAAPVGAEVYLRATPANQGAAEIYSLRNLALGEPSFANANLYNLYDQGASPLGLLDLHSEKLNLKLGSLSSNRSTPGDTLKLGHSDYYLPQVGFFQPGVFAVLLYFQHQSEALQAIRSDSVEISKNQFGFDLAAGPASGLFRLGFGAHMALGSMDYPGTDKRVILELPSLRVDAGSRPIPGVEVGAYVGMALHFDSLESKTGALERYASMTLPRYGILAAIDTIHELPIRGNTLVEFGTDRTFGEYKPNGGEGELYDTRWKSYWEMQTQWMYTAQAQDFVLQPAFRFAHRSEDDQPYEGIRSNQNPFKSGNKITYYKATTGITTFGLGGNFHYREVVSLLLEWERAGHSSKQTNLPKDTTYNQTYHRFSLGLENHLERFAALHFPPSVTLAVRAGWAWRQEPKSEAGYRDYQFSSLVSTREVASRWGNGFIPAVDHALGYSAFHLGFGLGLLNETIALNGLLSFPTQKEMRFFNRSLSPSIQASGLEWGLSAAFVIF
jgi:hypothetical protein